ncbi:MAG TPA: YeeE/YedE thiosulfate transporter family protein [Thermoleophilaceae bacterium]|nr:YeeE/YedE thiosulfate transporter family protein [Thermoleophilaceae bacterium]
MNAPFDQQLAWYVAGPIMGLCVVACRALFNGRLGVTGGFSEVVGKLRRGSSAFDWRGWFLIGVALSGTVFALLAGGQSFSGYGWLTETFHGAGQVAIPFVLLGAGVLVGYGAKTAGGCTSGNGLTGTSLLSPASLVSTATFFGTAIAVSFLIEAVI